MEIPHVGIAFLAGLLSFFSPCVLAVAPGYLGILTGTVANQEVPKRRAVLVTFLFVLGFTVVFMLLGTAFSLAGQFMRAYRMLLSQIMGAVVVFFGLHQIGLLKFGILYRENRPLLRKNWVGPFKPLVTGMAFAFGWTPCVGPILGTILAIAGNTAQPAAGFGLLGVYSLGMAIPFFLVAVAMTGFRRVSTFFLRHARLVEVFSGILLVVMGLLLFFNLFAELGQFLNQIFQGWSPENWLG